MFGEDGISGRDAIAAEFAQTLMGLPDLKASFARTWAKYNVEVLEWVITGARGTGSLVGLSVLTFAVRAWVYGNAKEMFDQVSAAKKWS
jgi:hypothetical protein